MKTPSMGLIFEDWPRKLAALILALIIWYSVYRQIQETETIREIPVVLVPPPDMAITNIDQVPRISITVRGPKRTISNLTANNIQVRREIPDSTPIGPYQIRLQRKDIKIQGRIQIQSIENGSFTINLDRIITVNRNVKVMLHGSDPPGFKRHETRITPPQVTLTGPARIIEEIDEITTQPIRLTDDVPENFYTIVSLASYPDVKMNPERVRVSMEYRREFDTASFAELPITILQGPDTNLEMKEIDAASLRARVIIRGPITVLDEKLTPSSLRTFIDLSSESRPGTYKFPVQLWIGEKDCEAISIEPKVIEVTLKRRVNGEETGATTPAAPAPAAAAAPTAPAEAPNAP